MGQFRTAFKIRRKTNFQSTWKNVQNSASVFLKPNTEKYFLWHQSPQIFLITIPTSFLFHQENHPIFIHVQACSLPPCTYHFCYLLHRAKSSPLIEEPVGKATQLLPVVLLYTILNLTFFSASHALFEMSSGLYDWEHQATHERMIIIITCIGTTISQTYWCKILSKIIFFWFYMIIFLSIGYCWFMYFL